MTSGNGSVLVLVGLKSSTPHDNKQQNHLVADYLTHIEVKQHSLSVGFTNTHREAVLMLR